MVYLLSLHFHDLGHFNTNESSNNGSTKWIGTTERINSTQNRNKIRQNISRGNSQQIQSPTK